MNFWLMLRRLRTTKKISLPILQPLLNMLGTITNTEISIILSTGYILITTTIKSGCCLFLIDTAVKCWLTGVVRQGRVVILDHPEIGI